MAVRRTCVNDPNTFCFICGEYSMFKQNRRGIDANISKWYYAYFRMKLGDQDKPWAPHNVCQRCYLDLFNWWKHKQTSLRFGIPMIWHEPTNHSEDCYTTSVLLMYMDTIIKTEAKLYTRRRWSPRYDQSRIQSLVCLFLLRLLNPRRR